MSPLMEEQKKVSHVLHLLLSIITCGFWVPVWFIICLSISLENRGIRKRNEKRYIKERDQLMYNHLQVMNKR